MAKKKPMNISFRLKISWDAETAYRIRKHLMPRTDSQDSQNMVLEGDPDHLVFEILESAVIEWIPELKNELNKFADGAIEEVRIDSIYEGSFISLFTIVWNAANTVKDAYDIVHMVNEVTELFISGKLKKKFRTPFFVGTHAINYDKPDMHSLNKTIQKETKSKRDAFFYYLLIANVVQAFVIGALVYGAVMLTYFNH